MTNKSKIPEFATYQEEAELWDTYDFTDFEDETGPVEVSFVLNSASGHNQKKLRQDWAGMLEAPGSTSVELQHLANEIRSCSPFKTSQ